MTRMRRSATLIGLMVGIASVAGAIQGTKFPTGSLIGSDGTNNFSLNFDSTGTINVYVNNQPFSSSKYESKADTIWFGVVNAAEGYGCAGDGTYVWKLNQNRMTFTTVKDECQIRMTTLTGVAWTRG